jgi:putative ABC transport system permease protein
MESLRQDLAYALRRLSRSPVFTLVAVATLALGIGANTAIFSVINGVLLQPLPFPEPERLVLVSQVWKGKPTVVSPQNFLDLQAQAGSFASMAAYDNGGVILTGGGTPTRLEGAQVSASFFDLLRVAPALGRGFLDGENDPARSKVVVLGHRLWSERFGADPSILGRTIQLDRTPFEVVGIAPAGFSYPESAQLWTPLEYDEVFRHRSRGAWYLTAIGRLKDGVPVEQAGREAALVGARLAQQYPDANEGVGATVGSLHESMVGKARPALLVLLGAVGFVLLIACVNVANLLLARVAAREPELALRSALGASRSRLLRQLMTESVLLSVIGGAAGILLASLSLGSLLALQPADMPRLDEIRLDRTVLAFATVLSLVTGLLFGSVPALHMARRATAQSLREGARSLIGGHGGPLRAGLVVGQVALAMVLLAGAGLLGRSFMRLRHVEPGFDPRSALTFRIALPESAYPEEPARAAFVSELLARLAAVPGVRQVGAVMGLPLGGTRFNLSFEVDGRPALTPAQQPSMEVRVATPQYFGTMGIPVKRGRGFLPTDVAGSLPVAVITEAAAARYFPGEDPLGQRITLGWRRPDGKPRAGGVVVGIVGDVREHGLAMDYPAEIYVPYAQLPVTAMDLVMRTSVAPESLLPSVQAVLHGLDPEMPAARPRTLEAIVSRSLGEPRFYVTLLGAFAFTALALAALGIFGVMSYLVVQRSREIGIRIALGALPRDILRGTLREALLLAGAGVVLGLAGALGLSRTLRSLLFELSPNDPATLLAVAVLLTVVAVLASWLPARRASRVDPLAALRIE